MTKNRYISTSIWEDEYIGELQPSEKLLFIYLLTNTHTNIAGMYPITMRKIKFDTGLDNQTISKAFKGFQNNSKAFFINQKYVILPNFIKHQKLNNNIKVDILSIVNNLPICIKQFLNIGLKAFDVFDELCKALNYSNSNSNFNTNKEEEE